MPYSHFGSGGGAGKVDISPFSLVKVVDGFSPRLFDYLVRGRQVRDAEILLFDEGAQPDPNHPEECAAFRYTTREVAITGIELDTSRSPVTEKSVAAPARRLACCRRDRRRFRAERAARGV
jgi:hypothetical protein